MLLRTLGGLACFVIGIGGIHLSSTLPSLAWLVVMTAVAFVAWRAAVWWRPHRAIWLLAAALLLAGFCYAGLRAHWRMAGKLDAALENRVILTEGYVTGLPHASAYGMNFDFVSTRVLSDNARLPHRLSVQWYGEHPEIVPGSRWQLALKLKRPHGQQNPGGYDMEGWLWQHAIGGTASVKVGSPLTGVAWQAGIDRLRARVAARIRQVLAGSDYAGVIVATAIGDRNGISKEQWARYAASGTSHLLVISGLHITMLAGLASALTGLMVRQIRPWARRASVPRMRLYAALTTAIAYSVLAGLGVPTQRAVIMLASAMFCLLRARPMARSLIWAIALCAVLLWDPFAIGAAGFWLSFLAVGSLLWLGSNRIAPLRGWRFWGRTELAATLGTLPIIVCVFGSLPLVSPLANAVAIPLVSLLVTPLTLIGLAEPSGYALHAAERVFAITDWLITLAVDWCPAPLLTPPPLWAALPGLTGVLVLLLPRGMPGKALGLFMLLPLCVVKPSRVAEGQFNAMVIDVGQGLAVLVQTRQHSLLFDTGQPGQADRAVLPALRSLGIKRLDTLVVSHKDSDHAGSAEALLRNITIDMLRSSLPAGHMARTLARRHTPCMAGQSWDWDGVNFTLLWPDDPAGLADENARSCVLQISAGGAGQTRLLLTADVGKEQEAQMLQHNWLAQQHVVIAGHHGSNTSSSTDFVQATAPQWVVYSAGYLNRFNHPRPEIVARYAAAGAATLRTDHDGAVLIQSGAPVQIQSWRALHAHYWFTAPPL